MTDGPVLTFVVRLNEPTPKVVHLKTPEKGSFWFHGAEVKKNKWDF